VDPETETTPAFASLRRVLAAVGRTPQDIVKCTVFVRDRAIRAVISKYRAEMFPDEASRPARHTLRIELQGPQAAPGVVGIEASHFWPAQSPEVAARALQRHWTRAESSPYTILTQPRL